MDSEFSSYGYKAINPAIYEFFSLIGNAGVKDIRKRFENAEYLLRKEFAFFSGDQQEWNFDVQKVDFITKSLS